MWKCPVRGGGIRNAVAAYIDFLSIGLSVRELPPDQKPIKRLPDIERPQGTPRHRNESISIKRPFDPFPDDFRNFKFLDVSVQIYQKYYQERPQSVF